MEEFFICRNGNLFTYLPKDSNDIDTNEKEIWANIKVGYSGSLVYASFEVNSGYDFYDKYDFGENIEGHIYHKDGFGEVWNLGWEVSNGRDKWNDAKVLSFSGGEYTSQFGGPRSIISSICLFLNNLYQFNDIFDYILFYKENIKDSKQILSEETKDQILELAELIQLCEKYSKINPNKPFIRTLNSDIEKRIRWILKDKKS